MIMQIHGLVNPDTISALGNLQFLIVRAGNGVVRWQTEICPVLTVIHMYLLLGSALSGS